MPTYSTFGSDSAALLHRGPVISVDQDESMLLRAKWNLEAWRASGHLSREFEWSQSAQDVTRHLPAIPESALLHVDPDRRVNRERAASVVTPD